MDVEDLLNTLKKVPDKNIPISTFGGRVVKIQVYEDRVTLITDFINKYLTVRQCAQQLLNCDSKWNVYVKMSRNYYLIKLCRLDFNNFKH